MAFIFWQKDTIKEKNNKIKSSVPVAGILALLVAGFITIISTCGITVASIHTKELLLCRQRLANSSEATEKDKIRASELQDSFWVILPKWVLASIIVIVGIITYASLSVTLLILFLRIRKVKLSSLVTTNTS